MFKLSRIWNHLIFSLIRILVKSVWDITRRNQPLLKDITYHTDTADEIIGTKKIDLFVRDWE